jgi:hypothetical protein
VALAAPSPPASAPSRAPKPEYGCAPAAFAQSAPRVFVQRVATRGGAAPSVPCDASARGKRDVVTYQADSIVDRAG